MQFKPNAPEGLEYRSRSFPENGVVLNEDRTYVEQRKNTHGQYETTGLFPVGAADARSRNLHSIPTLYLDFDLVGWVRNQDPSLSAAEAKYELHRLPEEQLQLYLEGLLAEARNYAPAATSIVCSGYGYHMYFWLPSSIWEDLDRCRHLQKQLVLDVNNKAGYELADAAVKDAGTRVLRSPGTFNTKGPLARSVSVLFCSEENLAADTLESLSAPPSYAESRRVELFDRIEQEGQALLTTLLTDEPFVSWCYNNPCEVGLLSWYAAATQIAAVAGEDGRSAYHDLSRQDPDRYDEHFTSAQYDRALEQVREHGPQRYETLVNNGDWPGTGVPRDQQSPAQYARFLSTSHELRQEHPDAPLVLNNQGTPRAIYTNLRRILRSDSSYRGRLRYNMMRYAPVLDDEVLPELQTGTFIEEIQSRYEVEFSRKAMLDGIREIAWENRYSPVVEYLESLEWDNKSRLSDLVKILGSEPSAQYEAYLRCFLVSAVRRALLEDQDGHKQEIRGVKCDTVLVFQGDQGSKKSSFFNCLAGEWFCDTYQVPGTKDAYMSLARHWIIEWAEFERVHGRKQDSINKAFLTSRVDHYRPPYARDEQSVPRTSVIVGTTNEQQFLQDATGDRRYHVVQTKDIDLVSLSGIRDQIWAEAVHMHRQGLPHWLQAEEEQARQHSNAFYRVGETWEDFVAEWLNSLRRRQKLKYITVDRILTEAVQKDVGSWTQADTMRVVRILKSLGYVKKRITTTPGARSWAYVPTDEVEPLRVLKNDHAEAE